LIRKPIKPETAARCPLDPNAYVEDVVAARLLSLSRGWLRQLRLSGGGPRYSKFGRAVRYRIADLFAWADARAVTSTSDRGA
jgi:hypothetical protein